MRCGGQGSGADMTKAAMLRMQTGFDNLKQEIARARMQQREQKARTVSAAAAAGAAPTLGPDEKSAAPASASASAADAQAGGPLSDENPAEIVLTVRTCAFPCVCAVFRVSSLTSCCVRSCTTRSLWTSIHGISIASRRSSPPQWSRSCPAGACPSSFRSNAARRSALSRSYPRNPATRHRCSRCRLFTVLCHHHHHHRGRHRPRRSCGRTLHRQRCRRLCHRKMCRRSSACPMCRWPPPPEGQRRPLLLLQRLRLPSRRHARRLVPRRRRCHNPRRRWDVCR
jgi:hypothetical protein